MHLKTLIPTILFLCIVTACTKKSTPAPLPPIPPAPAEDIYVTGSVILNGHHIATYWKNGKEINLETEAESSASTIAISGSDIYIAGNKTINGITHVVVWKNGVATDYGAGVASDMALQGNNIYISGYSIFYATDPQYGIYPYHVATYWKNGIPVLLNNPFAKSGTPLNSSADAIAISGDNVYMGGYSEISFDFGKIAMLWKNEVPTALTKAYTYTLSDESSVNDIAVHDNDIYAMGNIIPATGPESSPSGYSGAVYWKNDNIVQLPNDPVNSSPSYSITFSGSDMYLAGYSTLAPPTGVYLKNMAPTPLQVSVKPQPNSDLFTTVGNITVYNNDVYVAGSFVYRRSNQADEPLAVYWKNGAVVLLPSSNLVPGLQLGCAAVGIAVVKHQ